MTRKKQVEAGRRNQASLDEFRAELQQSAAIASQTLVDHPADCKGCPDCPADAWGTAIHLKAMRVAMRKFDAIAHEVRCYVNDPLPPPTRPR